MTPVAYEVWRPDGVTPPGAGRPSQRAVTSSGGRVVAARFTFQEGAVAQFDDAVGEGEELGVVGGDEGGDTLAVHDRAQELHHGTPGVGVELARRLVGDDQGRTVGQGAGDGHTLLLAAGQLTGALGGVPVQADKGEQEADALLALGAVGLAQPQRDADVLGGGEDRQQAEGLEDETDAVPAQSEQFAFTEPAELGAVDADTAGVGAVQPPMRLSSVVLPEPERPFRATSSPRPTLKDTPRTACTAVSPLP